MTSFGTTCIPGTKRVEIFHSQTGYPFSTHSPISRFLWLHGCALFDNRRSGFPRLLFASRTPPACGCLILGQGRTSQLFNPKPGTLSVHVVLCAWAHHYEAWRMLHRRGRVIWKKLSLRSIEMGLKLGEQYRSLPPPSGLRRSYLKSTLSQNAKGKKENQ